MTDDAHPTAPAAASADGPPGPRDPAARPASDPAADPDPDRVPAGPADRLRALLPTPGARLAAGAFALVTLVHLAAQLAGPSLVVVLAPGVLVLDTDTVAQVSQWFLMPLLALAVVAATPPPRPRLARLTALALLCSTAGDVLPGLVPPAWSFPVLVALFACAQVVYVVAFAPFRRASVLHRRALLLPYAVVYVAVVGTMAVMLGRAPGAGAGTVALVVVLVAVYGVLLLTMAVLATGVDRLAGAGAALFVLSDGLIGLTHAGVPWAAALPPGALGFVVMGTYAVGQALIAAGVRRRCVGRHA